MRLSNWLEIEIMTISIKVHMNCVLSSWQNNSVQCTYVLIFNFFHVEPNHKRIVFDISKQVEVKKGITSILQPILEKWTQQILAPNPIIHGIRRYLRGAAMQLHVDSLPRIISVILQVSAPICFNPRSNKVIIFSFLWKMFFLSVKVTEIWSESAL